MGYKVTAVNDEEFGNLQFQINLKFRIEPPPPGDLASEIEARVSQLLRGERATRDELAAAIQQTLDQINQ